MASRDNRASSALVHSSEDSAVPAASIPNSAAWDSQQDITPGWGRKRRGKAEIHSKAELSRQGAVLGPIGTELRRKLGMSKINSFCVGGSPGMGG